MNDKDQHKILSRLGQIGSGQISSQVLDDTEVTSRGEALM